MDIRPVQIDAHKYAHYAEVEGFGEFPFDMLRYDNAHPTEERDSGQLSRFASGLDGRRKVRVTALATTKRWPFTPARWESFGWTCKPVDRWEPRDEYERLSAELVMIDDVLTDYTQGE